MISIPIVFAILLSLSGAGPQDQEVLNTITHHYNAHLIGLDLYCAMLTYDTARLTPQDTSEAALIEIN